MSENNRVLYIDDNKDHLLIVKTMLGRFGYECDTFSRAQAGLDAALSGDYDVLLVDIQMPEKSGIAVLEELKTNQTEKNYRIVAITADSTIFANKSPYDLGFDGFLSKPIMPNDLSRMMQTLIIAPTD